MVIPFYCWVMTQVHIVRSLITEMGGVTAGGAAETAAAAKCLFFHRLIYLLSSVMLVSLTEYNEPMLMNPLLMIICRAGF